VIQPFILGGSVFGLVQEQGEVALANNNVTYRACAA
jgi:hypothetical protein